MILLIAFSEQLECIRTLLKKGASGNFLISAEHCHALFIIPTRFVTFIIAVNTKHVFWASSQGKIAVLSVLLSDPNVKGKFLMKTLFKQRITSNQNSFHV